MSWKQLGASIAVAQKRQKKQRFERLGEGRVLVTEKEKARRGLVRIPDDELNDPLDGLFG
jgi:hypothetical protein